MSSPVTLSSASPPPTTTWNSSFADESVAIARYYSSVECLPPGRDVSKYGIVLNFAEDQYLILSPNKYESSLIIRMHRVDLNVGTLPPPPSLIPKLISFDTSKSPDYVGMLQHQYIYAFDTAAYGYDIHSKRPIMNQKSICPLAKKSRGCTIVHDHEGRFTAFPPCLRPGVFMIGGRDKVTNQIRDNIQFFAHAGAWEERRSDYDPTRNTSNSNNNAASEGVVFTSNRRMPQKLQIARCNSAAVLVGSKLIVTGGFFWNREASRYMECIKTEVFDGDTGGASFGPDLNVARQNHCMVVLNQRYIVVLGGEKTVSGSRNQVPVNEIEVWDLFGGTSNNAATPTIQTARYEAIFVVLPSVLIPPRPKPKFQAVAHSSGRYIHLIGGESSDIDMITFDLDLLNSFVSSTILARAAAISTPPLSEDSSPIEMSGFDLPAPVIHPQQATRSWLPPPPSLPQPPVASTLSDRNKFMQLYVQRLQNIQEQYRRTIEESTELIKDYCNKEIDLVQFHGTSWLSNIEQCIQQAKEDMKLQDHFLSGKNKRQRNDDNGSIVDNNNEGDNKEDNINCNNDNTSRNSSSPLLDDKVVRLLKTNDHDDFCDDIPSQLRCPLTLDIMTDPVVAADGNTYERSALEDWFQKSKKQHDERNRNNTRQAGGGANKAKYIPRSPLTGAELSSESFFPVHTLRSMCLQFAQQEMNMQ